MTIEMHFPLMQPSILYFNAREHPTTLEEQQCECTDRPLAICITHILLIFLSVL